MNAIAFILLPCKGIVVLQEGSPRQYLGGGEAKEDNWREHNKYLQAVCHHMLVLLTGAHAIPPRVGGMQFLCDVAAL